MVLEFFKNFIFSKRAGSLVRRIAWLSVISICFSITAFLIVLFVMNGMNDSIQKRIVALEPHVIIRVPQVKDAKALQVHPAYVRLNEFKNLTVSVFESQDVVLRSAEGQFRGAIANGITPESMFQMQKRLDDLNKLKKNRDAFLERWEPHEIPGEGEGAIGADLAHALKVNEGDFLTVIPPEALLLPPGEAPRFDRIRIRKIVYTNLSDIDGQYLFYQRGKALLGLNNTTSRKIGLEVWTPNLSEVESIKDEVMKLEGVQAQTWKDRNSDLFFALKLEKIVIGVFLALAGVLSASSIVGVLSLLLYQKRREIKLLRALGFSSRHTVEVFTKIGLFLTLCGVVTGTILGAGVSYYIELFPLTVLPDVYYDTQVPALVDMKLVFLVLIIGIIIGLLGAWFPARKVGYEEIGKI